MRRRQIFAQKAAEAAARIAPLVLPDGAVGPEAAEALTPPPVVLSLETPGVVRAPRRKLTLRNQPDHP